MSQNAPAQSPSKTDSGDVPLKSATATPATELDLLLNPFLLPERKNKKNELPIEILQSLFRLEGDFLIRKASNKKVTSYQVSINRQTYYTARITWTLLMGSWPKHPMQFLDGDKTNIRLSNLFQPPFERIDTLSQKECQEFFHYNPESGVLLHKKRITSLHEIGEEVGYKDCMGYRKYTFNLIEYPIANIIWLYMTGEYPAALIDHENHIRDDNRFNNLRHTNPKGNAGNRSVSRNNTSGHMGVSWSLRHSKWRAYIEHEHIGLYNSLEEAALARREAVKQRGFHPNHGK